MNPSDNLVDWVLKTVPTMGAGWCPPGMLGIGIGGTAEKAMLLAKEVLMEPIDMFELLQRGPQNKLEELRIELYEKVNALGIGAQGLGGLTTVLDVKIATYPTHAASKPVAMIPNRAAEIDFEMPDVYHTFRKGHRVMVQVQSSWFPLTDRNPQTFMEIPKAKPEDFRKAVQRVYRSKRQHSSITVQVQGGATKE